MEHVLQTLVQEQRQSTGLVGLGAILVHNDEVIGPAVSGERKKRSDVLVTGGDKWHIGSITKSITATMIARLVEKKELDWNTSVKDMVSTVDGLNARWYGVTLEHLLTHTAGAPANFPLLVNLKVPAAGFERMRAREDAVIDILKKAPKFSHGAQFSIQMWDTPLLG